MGNRVRAKVVKNKVAPAVQAGRVRPHVRRGHLAGRAASSTWRVEAGVAKKSGAWYTYGEERLGQGREAAKQTLKENPDLREEIELKVREAFEIPVITRTADEADAMSPGGEARQEEVACPTPPR